MGAFVSLLPHAPTETPTQAYNQGQAATLQNQNYATQNQLEQAQIAQAQQQTSNAAQQSQLTAEQIKAAQLTNQQNQIQAQGQAALNTTIPKYVQPGPAGTHIIDWTGVMGDPNMQQHGALMPGMIDKANTQMQEGLKAIQAKADRVSSLLGSATDEASKNSAVIQAQGEGLLDPKAAQDYLNRPFDDTLKSEFAQHQRAAVDARNQLELAQRANQFSATMAIAAPKNLDEWFKVSGDFLGAAHDDDSLADIKNQLIKKGTPTLVTNQIPDHWDPATTPQLLQDWGVSKQNQPKYEQGDLEYVAQLLSGPAKTGQAAYERAYNAIPPAYKPLLTSFPQPDEYDADKTPAAVLTAGSTPAQTLNAQMAHDYRMGTLGLRKENTDSLVAHRAYEDSGPPPRTGGNNAGNGPLRTRWQQLDKQEGDLQDEQATINDKIKQGGSTDDRNGVNFGRDLKSELEDVTTRLTGVQKRKTNIEGQLGAGTPGRGGSGGNTPNSSAPAIGAHYGNGKQKVTWDGTNWIDDATKKPAKFQQ
jgi:hypothetical protein